ncbi:hypothetical protein WR25_23742 [Diploscapter pachys]|uniref:Uncharacterized protein n=1 Tax=Diploscapter pachys TaxID=2018661 RepID=A0A2A2JFK0_9BILA|nr:hypothetical protein WR25_23742 [Diploscapter pachys]
MDDASSDLVIPDIPLASIDEDIDSNKNSQSSDSVEEANDNIIEEEDRKLNDELSLSLEDLVGNFDEKIRSCLRNPTVNTDDIAPVQIRTQDDVMKESQTWWTLTGNFGNIQPLDLHKSMIRNKMVRALELSSSTTPKSDTGEDGGVADLSDEEELRHRLDMHQLISHHPNGSYSTGDSPPQTADQVIEEIDRMLQSCDPFNGSMMSDRTMESVDSMYSSMRSPPLIQSTYDSEAKLRQAHMFAANPTNLEELSYSKLVTLAAEMEQLIQVYNESLVEELAHRDELEYEKEMKNSFISLLLSIQNKRRQFAAERKKKGKADSSQPLPQYMTTLIPYDEFRNLDNTTLNLLIKVLKAVNEDNPAVPNLLTEYILKVVCPKS